MFNPEQIEGSVWVLGYEDEGDKYFVCRKLFEHDGKQYGIMFSLFDSEIEALEKEDGEEACTTCGCESHEKADECAECCSDENEGEERDLAVLRIVAGVDGEPDVLELTEEEDKDLEETIEEVLELIDEEDEEEDEEEDDEDDEE